MESGKSKSGKNRRGSGNDNSGSQETSGMGKDADESDKPKRKRKDRAGSLGSEPKSSESNNNYWWIAFILVISVSAGTRLYKVDQPDHICWDETHFGKFGSWYINRSFFFDVHPPLGKMLIGLFGTLTGYNGSFAFNKPGDKYEDVPYIGMRVCCAVLGSCLAPFAYVTVWEISHSLLAAVLASVLILFDNGLITLTQYILLDPILMFFIMGSVMCHVKFQSTSDRPFSLMWWFWLSLTGIFLSCSVSVKFVGVFVVIVVGYDTIFDLWDIFGDLTKPVLFTVRHFLSRAMCLIVLPISLYILFFYIHLKVLNKSGTGDGFFSSAFQSQLIGNSLHNASMPKEVAFGAIITLKNHRTGGGYLHSHWHLYPEGIGARQQQVTTYSHKDDNNRWIIKRYDKNPDLTNPKEPIELIKNGDLVRLEHLPTKRNLHSHKEVAPMTKKHHQVTCYGENGTGDANDVWKIDISGGYEGEIVTTITTKLKFVHLLSGCALHSHNRQLPKWAYEQMEVSCNPQLWDKNNLWNVEDNTFPKLPNVSFEVYAPSFWERFAESHAVMFQSNAGLKPKEGEVTSKPWQWPINFRGQFFSGNQFRIYLLGNPIIWWGNLVLMLAFTWLWIYHSFRLKRGYSDPQQERRQTVVSAGVKLLFAWTCHYVPFWGMARILYYHHYFPAHLFASMISGIILDYLIEKIANTLSFIKNFGPVVYHSLVALVLSTIIYSFYLYSPLTYGMEGPYSHEANSTLAPLRLLDSWEF